MPDGGRASGTTASSRLRVLAGLVVVAILALALGLMDADPHSGITVPQANKNSPNFLVVMVDDQALNTFTSKAEPQTYRWIVDHGTNFSAGIAAPPLCCPDRAGILTGQYPHNHGVHTNHPGYQLLNDNTDTLATWLDNAGYRTGLSGKFLNGYTQAPDGGLNPAPGFDYWFSFFHTPAYFDYTVSDNGTKRSYGSGPKNYSTDVMTSHAVHFMSSSARQKKPFFLWVTYHAPHFDHEHTSVCGSYRPKPLNRKAVRRYRNFKLPRPPSFNERNVSDKPNFVRNAPSLSKSAIQGITRGYQCTLAAMHEVDVGVGKMMRTLQRSGELSDTVVFYLSDNGFFFGEHRLVKGKAKPYEPSINVPYAVRVPASLRREAPPPSVGQVVSNQDVAPTILDYAGGLPSCASGGDCRRMDGHSLRPLLGGHGSWPKHRGVLVELKSANGHYAAVRTRHYVYIHYHNGFKELYDLKNDPGQLSNQAGSPAYATVESGLRQRLRSLKKCSGVKGRDPASSGVPFCE